VPETITVPASVELAVVERSGFVESRHAGSAIVLDAEGAAALTLGDVETPILPRSSLKPLQALGSLTAGAVLDGERLALATASHAGTDRTSPSCGRSTAAALRVGPRLPRGVAERHRDARRARARAGAPSGSA
jgi:L-asparaginase II